MTLDELRVLCDKATPGPWKYDKYGVITLADLPKDRVDGFGIKPGFVCDLNDREYHWYNDQAEQDAVGQFIAAARNYMPALLELAAAATKTVGARWEDILAPDTETEYALWHALHQQGLALAVLDEALTQHTSGEGQGEVQDG